MAISVSNAFKEALNGPVDSSQIKIEVLFSGATWTDITSFVLDAGGTQEELSQLTNGASANTLNLTLINDDGRFSPKNTASPYAGNLLPNKPIRVSSVHGSESVRLFTGYVSNWIPNAKQRNCQVTAEDAARILRRRDIVEETVFNPDTPTSGYYLTRVLERAAWLSGLRWDTCNTKTDTSSNAWAFSSHDGMAITVNKSGGATRATYTLAGVLVMTLDLVDLLMPVTPLKGKALAVLDQLAKVVDGAIYFDAQGQLVFRSRMYRNDSTLASVETLTVSSLEDVTAQTNFEDSRWAQIVNRATVRSTPYTFKTDATGAVLEEEIPFKGDLFGKFYFAPSESYPASGDADLYCEIPNGIKLFKTATYPTAANLVLRSVDNADPTKESNSIKFKAGYPVFEQSRIKVAFENTGSAAERIQMLTFRGKLMRPVQKCQSVQRNDASIALYDQRDREVNNDLIPNANACKNLAAWLVEDGRNPKTVLTLPVMFGIPWLELGDKITVSETITHTVPVSEDFIVRRITWRWSLAVFAFTIEACTPAADFTAGSLPVAVVNVETSNQNNQGTTGEAIPIAAIDHSGAQVGLNNIPVFQNVLNAYRKFPYSGSHINEAVMGDSANGDNAALFALGNNVSGKSVKINPLTAAVEASATLTDGGSPIAFTLAAFISYGGLRYIWGSGYKTGGPNPNKLYLISTDLSTVTVKHTLAPGESVTGIVQAGDTVWAVIQVGSGSHSSVKLLKWTDLSASAAVPDATYTIAAGESGFDKVARRPIYDGSRYLYVPTTRRDMPGGGDAEGRILRVAVSDGSTVSYSVPEDVRSIAISPGYLWTSGYLSPSARVKRYGLTPIGVSEISDVSVEGLGLLTFDGRNILVAGISGIDQINPLTGQQLGSYSYFIGTQPNGMAFDGEAMWLTSGSDFLVRVRIIEGR